MKKRLDIILVERGLVDTRTKAQALIMAGEVSGDGRILDKPGQTFDEAMEIHLKHQPPYVSRAGEKLASVAEELNLNFAGLTVLDVGSSTGGFTDFALQNGATRVYCVDVGTGQLAYKLRQDPRVVVMEQTDIRDVMPPSPSSRATSRDLSTSVEMTGGEEVKMTNREAVIASETKQSQAGDNRAALVMTGKSLPELAGIAVMDVSFISLEKVLEPTAALIKPGSRIVAMAKPQFEAGRELATKHAGVIPLGVERDEVLKKLRSWIAERFEIEAEADSGLSGAEGNVEHFFKLRIGM